MSSFTIKKKNPIFLLKIFSLENFSNFNFKISLKEILKFFSKEKKKIFNISNLQKISKLIIFKFSKFWKFFTFDKFQKKKFCLEKLKKSNFLSKFHIRKSDLFIKKKK